MKKVDGRTRSWKRQQALRMQVLRELLGGESPSRLFKRRGVARSSLYNWLSRYRQGGWQAVKTKPYGAPRKLTETQVERVKRAVKSQTPLDFGFTAPFWTLGLVHAFILRKLGVKITLGSVNNLVSELRLRRYLLFRRGYNVVRKPTLGKSRKFLRVLDRHLGAIAKKGR